MRDCDLYQYLELCVKTQNLFSPGGACDVLIKVRQNLPELSAVGSPGQSEGCISVVSLLDGGGARSLSV